MSANRLGAAGKNGYKIDFASNTIYLNYKFSQAAGVIGSDEYHLYCKITEAFPNMKIVIRSGRNAKTSHINKRRTYANMEKYISCFENREELMHQFELAKAKSAIFKSPYAYVNDWFDMQFPDYKDVGSVGNKTVKLVSLPSCEKHKLKDDAAASF